MPATRSHDRTYIEPERHDALSDGVAVSEQADAGHERTRGGQLAKGASTTPTKGGKAHKGTTRATHRIEAIKGVDEQLLRRARFYRRKQCHELAATVGAGHCRLMASLLVKLASEDMVLRETALREGHVDLARKLGESTRMHLLYAREIAAKDGAADKTSGARDPLYLEGGTTK
jgi:hypothetical protein